MQIEKCVWCDGDFYQNELSPSRFLGGLVCPNCNADEAKKPLSQIQEKLRERAVEAAKGRIMR